MTGQPLLQVSDLAVSYGHRRGQAVRALRGVSFAVQPGETVAIVGESGTGKSTLGGAVLGLVPASGGTIRYAGRDITRCGERERRELASEIQAVFQNPHGSFNPSRKVRDAVVEPLLTRPKRDRGDLDAKVDEMLRHVGLPADIARSYPQQLSGGQLQRLAIARALIARPRLVVLDEALSSLDLSVQAQIVNLLIDLREEFGLAYLFISHDLDIVKHLAHRVLVLYRGHVVEDGPARAVCENPQHPYSRDLVASVPVPDPVLQRKRRAARGPRAEPLPVIAEAGCPFAARCGYAVDACARERPPAVAGPDGSTILCHRYPEAFTSDPQAAQAPAAEAPVAQSPVTQSQGC